MEAPKSSKVWVNCWYPMVQGMVKVPGSLHLGGRLGWIKAETFLPILTFSVPFSFLLWVHISFKNLAYLGICLIASKRGIFTSTFWKVSIISLSKSVSTICLDCIIRFGKGRGMLQADFCGCSLFCFTEFSVNCWFDLAFCLDVVGSFVAESATASCFSGSMVESGIICCTGPLICLPLRKAIENLLCCREWNHRNYFPKLDAIIESFRTLRRKGEWGWKELQKDLRKDFLYLFSSIFQELMWLFFTIITPPKRYS